MSQGDGWGGVKKQKRKKKKRIGVMGESRGLVHEREEFGESVDF